MGITKISGILIITSFFVFTFWFCRTEDAGSNCYGCRTTEPDSAEMIIKISISSQNSSVPVKVYLGKYNLKNPGTPIFIDTVKTSELKYYVPTNKTYSAVATYKDGNRVVEAVDGSVFNREEQTGCEITCWQLYGGELDVRLKDY